MKFGKLASIEQVDFRLPADPPENIKMLQKAVSTQVQPAFYIGCTGWSMKEWVGSVYPKGAKTKDFLKHYTRQFNTIELNTTHYRIPTPATIDRWKSESAPDFHFCPKIPQTISHSSDLGLNSDQLLLFCDHIQDLGEKLGCCFMQLPPYFGHDRLPLLESFLDRFPAHIPLALEVRHESWFENDNNSEQLFKLLERKGVSTVLTDVAGRRDVLHMRLTTATAMVRFVGNGLHPSDYERIDDWVKRISHWFDQGLSRIYFFTHEPDNILAPELAVYLLQKVQERKRIQVRGPKLIDEEQSNPQMRLF